MCLCSGDGWPFSHAMFQTCTSGLSRIFVAPGRGYAGGRVGVVADCTESERRTVTIIRMASSLRSPHYSSGHVSLDSSEPDESLTAGQRCRDRIEQIGIEIQAVRAAVDDRVCRVPVVERRMRPGDWRVGPHDDGFQVDAVVVVAEDD